MALGAHTTQPGEAQLTSNIAEQKTSNSGARVLVSSCLLGAHVRYDGRSSRVDNALLSRWWKMNLVVPLCPELLGGLTVPRSPAEILGHHSGEAVLDGRARVVSIEGVDHTASFIRGATAALAAARRLGICAAVLKDGSPSCGSRRVHDGTFSGVKVVGEGVTAALLRQGGIRVFSDTEFQEADAYLMAILLARSR